MTSTNGSSTHSPVETAAVVAHGRIDVERRRRSRPCSGRVRGGRARRRTGERPAHGRRRRGRDDPAHARAPPGNRRPGDRRQLRPCRLSRVDCPRSARGRSGTGLRGRVPDDRAADAGGAARRRGVRCRQRRRRDKLDARADDRARLGDRGRRPRRGAVRRDDLLHALRLDRVQPLERRPRARPRARRDGDHLHRAALARRPAARRAAWRRAGGEERNARTWWPLSSSTASAPATSRRSERCRSGSGPSEACSRRCPRRRSSAATARRSRPKERMGGVGRRVYDRLRASSPPHREPRPHP